MSLPSLGFCAPNADTLSYSGMSAVWTPDGHGGGELVVDVEAGVYCGGAGDSYALSLFLKRSSCGKKYRVNVDGNGSNYDAYPLLRVYSSYEASAIVLSMIGGYSGSICDSRSLVVYSGSNPVDVVAGPCAAGGFEVTINGAGGVNPAIHIVVTITPL